ncbi:maleylacetate reductase [Actinoplanes regularis]|uniref:Maleylacetate reductase n=1 Tax=Actinoplanes regularis TaxID=52697 RepID=A0A239K4H6_9ACTN|nr:maleylacetate reductase [Actinoplanes regularis]GIE92392.1 maleylacetate reductase [Actinoplanes regularis]SNT12592.1 maleylacetate reductase [Actinoplanes regularis]
MSLTFTHETLPQRVVFASNQAVRHVAAEVARLGRRPLVIAAGAERHLAEPVLAALPDAAHHREVAMHVPVAVAERARAAAAEHDADVLVSVGGGSTTGLAKAVALTTGLPIVAVPTTYAGSEATDVWGLTENGRKTTGSDRRVLPRTVIYDAALTLSLPAELSVASGLNALAHCVDSMWAPRTDPVNQALALAGVRALSSGLPLVLGEPHGLEGREQALYGAYLAAVAFASAGSGLHHKICHVLGGMFNLPHAQTHAVVLPQVLALNAPAVPDRERQLAEAFGAETASGGLRRLRTRIDAPRALRDHGMRETDLPAAIDAILAVVPAGNPVPVTAARLDLLLRRAWAGEEPE